MKDLSNIKTVKEIISKNGFKFSKSLGQNFIIDPEVCPKMAQSCSESEGIIEIGPGIGTLTLELAKRFKKVVAIEIDKRLIPIIKSNFEEFTNVSILNQDILKTDIDEIINKEFKGFESVGICANLPYYITSEVIMHLLESRFKINSITVMVQKEAAERICASPGTRKSGAISVAVRYFGDPKILFNVNKTCFIPAPNVDSSVIKIDIKNSNSARIKDKDTFFKVVKAAYFQRRKNLLNSLSAGLGISKNEISLILEKSFVNPSLRAENLKFEDFINISNVIFENYIRENKLF